MQASQLKTGFSVLETAMKIENEELGAREGRLMVLYDLTASWHNEVKQSCFHHTPYTGWHPPPPPPQKKKKKKKKTERHTSHNM